MSALSVKRRPRLTQARLKFLLSYNPASGFFRWNVSGGRKRKGEVAGKVNANGYRYIGIDGQLYLAHRLAWLYVTGQMPDSLIDHQNRTRDDNTFSNLRLATVTQNLGNADINVRNTSGFRGVSKDNSKKQRGWQAYINRQNRKYHLGYFPTASQAALAYNAAAISHFGEFAALNEVAA